MWSFYRCMILYAFKSFRWGVLTSCIAATGALTGLLSPDCILPSDFHIMKLRCCCFSWVCSFITARLCCAPRPLATPAWTHTHPGEDESSHLLCNLPSLLLPYFFPSPSWLYSSASDTQLFPLIHSSSSSFISALLLSFFLTRSPSRLRCWSIHSLPGRCEIPLPSSSSSSIHCHPPQMVLLPSMHHPLASPHPNSFTHRFFLREGRQDWMWWSWYSFLFALLSLPPLFF